MTELILVVLIDVLCLGLKVQTWTIRAWTFLTDSATPGVKVPTLWFFFGGLGVGKIIFCVCLTITDSIGATDDTFKFFFYIKQYRYICVRRFILSYLVIRLRGLERWEGGEQGRDASQEIPKIKLWGEFFFGMGCSSVITYVSSSGRGVTGSNSVIYRNSWHKLRNLPGRRTTHSKLLGTSVSDLYSFQTDPD